MVGSSVTAAEMSKSCLFSQCNKAMASNHSSYLCNYIGARRGHCLFFPNDIYLVKKKKQIYDNELTMKTH